MKEAARAIDVLSENASHFLSSSLAEVKKDTDEGNRNAVIFVAAALEVLLKTRIAMEHWSLIFDDPGRAKIADLASGDFVSVQAAKLVGRLNDITSLGVSDNIPKDFFKLRNRVIHFAPPNNIAIRVEVARGLNYALDLMHHHILPGLESSEREPLERLRSQLISVFNALGDFKKKRLIEISGALRVKPIVVVCPDCLQEALPLDDEGQQSCLFCLTTTEGSELAQRYIANVLRWTWRDEVDGGDHPVHECFECKKFALVDGSIVIKRPNIRYTCFSCAGDWSVDDLVRCNRCGNLMPSDDEVTACHDCIAALVTR